MGDGAHTVEVPSQAKITPKLIDQLPMLLDGLLSHWSKLVCVAGAWCRYVLHADILEPLQLLGCPPFVLDEVVCLNRTSYVDIKYIIV